MSPAESIVQVASRLEAMGPAPGSAESRFCDGVRRWISEGGSLDAALGLCGEVGIETARTRYLRAQRDYHLRQAHGLVSGDSAWSRSVVLAEEVSRFLSLVWPRWRDLSEPPEGCSDLRRHLFLAHRSGSLPESPRQLHVICTGI